MRSNNALLALCVALCCVDTAVGSINLHGRLDPVKSAIEAANKEVNAAQSSSGSSPASTSTASAVTSSTIGSYNALGSTARTDGESSTGSSAHASSNQATSRHHPSTLTTSTSIAEPNPTSSAAVSKTATGAAASSILAAAKQDVLPIQPKITPAIGIAGAILLVSGVALTLIGIKHKWLYIFLSTGFLTSLAVTVLIEYVMNPPVSDGIQGAYMVAVVITGLIFGALSLVFKEVTDGLGCLLGGFCLAMWFLVLRPDGLVSSTSGRVILIAVFCVACFSLSFSHYTRNYGLIVCTSFAGAMITIIGIDCFSCAGLKEFWLYIWNLNHNLFPVGTNTYPITRGIRVEIACTIILFLLGLMSQFKIWKIVKEKREKRAAEQAEDEENRNQHESEIGKQVEQSNAQDLAHWEAVYGDQDMTNAQHPDSGIGSSVSLRKGSMSVKESQVNSDVEEIEMDDLHGAMSRTASKRGSKAGARAVVTVRVASDESVERASTLPEEEVNLIDTRNGSGAKPQRSISPRSTPRHSSRSSEDSQRPASRRSLAAGPAIIPLPFSPPMEENEDQHSGAETEASKGSVTSTMAKRRRRTPERLSLKNDSDEYGFMVQHIEDDRASSVAATADEEPDVEGLSLPAHSRMPSPYEIEFNKDALSPNLVGGQHPGSSRTSLVPEEPVEENDDEALFRPESSARENQPFPIGNRTNPRARRASAANSGKKSIGDHDSDKDDMASAVGNLQGQLPERLSKVAMSYRTNEWAKHAAEADQPELETFDEPTSAGIQVDHAFKEAAAPVHVEALQEMAVPTAQPIATRNASQMSSNNPYKQSTTGMLSRTASGSTATPVYVFQPTDPQASSQRQSTMSSFRPKVNTQGRRLTSAPLLSQTLVESPIEEALAASGPYRNSYRNSSLPLGMSSTTLLGKRSDMIVRRTTSTSFMPVASTPNLAVIAASDSSSAGSVRLEESDSDITSLSQRKQLLDEDDMTLAERRALMQSSAFREQSQSRLIMQQTHPVPARNLIYDSHQPKRYSTVDNIKQNAMLAQWRQSMQADAAARQPLVPDDTRRHQMMYERRQVQVEYEAQRRQAERGYRESMIDSAMRNGQMHDAHRDALRRMQAKANRA